MAVWLGKHSATSWQGSRRARSDSGSTPLLPHVQAKQQPQDRDPWRPQRRELTKLAKQRSQRRNQVVDCRSKVSSIGRVGVLPLHVSAGLQAPLSRNVVLHTLQHLPDIRGPPGLHDACRTMRERAQ